MKQANFPEHKNIRRKKALFRLQQIKEPNDKQKREIEILRDKVEPSMRDHKSRKYRGDKKTEKILS